MPRSFLMTSQRPCLPRVRLAAVCAMHLAVSATPSAQPVSQAQLRGPDVAYASAPPAIVQAMLELAKVTGDDVVYDLGCGDGRIVVAAVKLRDARGVGVDIDPDRIEDATELALREGVTDRVTFVLDDLFQADFADATVVMLYLQPEPNLRLRPRLLTELRPGTRVVSLSYDMGEWAPDEVRRVDGRRIYLWTIPPRAQPGAGR
jgi:SAM-dependent methyltransferase